MIAKLKIEIGGGCGGDFTTNSSWYACWFHASTWSGASTAAAGGDIGIAITITIAASAQTSRNLDRCPFITKNPLSTRHNVSPSKGSRASHRDAQPDMGAVPLRRDEPTTGLFRCDEHHRSRVRSVTRTLRMSCCSDR